MAMTEGLSCCFPSHESNLAYPAYTAFTALLTIDVKCQVIAFCFQGCDNVCLSVSISPYIFYWFGPVLIHENNWVVLNLKITPEFSAYLSVMTVSAMTFSLSSLPRPATVYRYPFKWINKKHSTLLILQDCKKWINMNIAFYTNSG